MSDSLKFIVNNVNKLLDTEYNMISFDSLNGVALLQVLVDVLSALDSLTPMNVEKALEETVINIMKALQSVKYVPPSNLSVSKFREGVAVGDPSVIYPILYWLLSNQKRVRELAYLSKYVEKLVIAPEALADADVQTVFRVYEKTIEDFWSLYSENNTGRKASVQASELQEDIKKMAQEMANISQRIDAQRAKMNNIPNREGLVVVSRGYRNARLEEQNLIKQGKENIEMIKQLEFQLKDLEETLATTKIKRPTISNILEQTAEEYHINKIFYDSQLPEELAEVKKDVMVYEKVANDSTPPQEYLQKYNITLKDDIQNLMGEKLSRFSNTEDQLGPFRNQAAMISNKKQDVSNAVRELRENIQKLDDTTKEKEMMLYNLVGGEILHGDQLKQFIAKLREKSVEYKRCRTQLQNLTSELGVTSRTLDVLKSIDPSVDEALLTEKKSNSNPEYDEFSETIAEAKQACKLYLNELENLKASTAQVYNELSTTKNATEEIATQHEEVKRVFEKATEFIANEIKSLKDSIREKNEKIQHHEEVWKRTTQEFEKCEYMFTRLLEDLVSKADTSARSSYFDSLNQKMQTVKTALEVCEKDLLQIEESKKQQREIVDFLKSVEHLLMVKLEGK